MAKRPLTLDAEALRAFVTGMEMGSFVLAAARLGRSTSAVSAQLRKLEQQTGAALVQKSGRHLALTPQGEILLGYARRLLSLNDEACMALEVSNLSGEIRLGLQEDFGEVLLPSILGQFSRAHPEIQISATVARNVPLLAAIQNNQLDLAVSWQGRESPTFSRSLGTVALRWIATAEFTPHAFLSRKQPLPLLVFDAPCAMRTAATSALDNAGIPWRIAFTSRSLSGIWAAAAAGLGVTLRTEIGMPPSLRALDNQELPAAGEIGISLHYGESRPSAAAQSLHRTIVDTFVGQVPPDVLAPPGDYLRR